MKLWESDIEIDEQKVKLVIERHFPALFPVQVEKLGQGWDSAVFTVNKRLVFLFSRKPFPPKEMQMQFALMRALAPETDIPIPDPLYTCDASPLYPYPFYGYPYLPGKTACSFQLSEKERAGMAKDLGRFLHTVHTFDVEQAKQMGIVPDLLGRLDVPKKLVRLHENLDQIKELKLFDAVETLKLILTETLPFVHTTEKVVLHGDFYLRHLLLDEKKKCAA